MIIDSKQHHKRLLDELSDTYARKNADYGDSFHTGFNNFGLISGVVRISDKYERLVNLVKGGKRQVNDETIRDTLMDMANYCIMSVMELEREE